MVVCINSKNIFFIGHWIRIYTSINMENSKEHVLQSPEFLHYLYECWEPQCTKSYRKSATFVEKVEVHKEDNTKATKFKTVETVVETINIMRTPRTHSRGNITRFSSLGSTDSVSPIGPLSRRSSVKRSVSQNREVDIISKCISST